MRHVLIVLLVEKWLKIIVGRLQDQATTSKISKTAKKSIYLFSFYAS